MGEYAHQGGEANARNQQISRLRKLDWKVHGVYASPKECYLNNFPI
jgi:hypothetical protein